MGIELVLSILKILGCSMLGRETNYKGCIQVVYSFLLLCESFLVSSYPVSALN